MHHSRQQWLVAQWLGLSFTVRVRDRARARARLRATLLHSFFFFFFFCLSVLKVTNTFVLHVNGSCGVQWSKNNNST